MYQLKEAVIEEYWLKKLSGELPKISLPLVNHTEKREQASTTPAGAVTIELPIPLHAADRLKKVAKNSHMGLFILFLSALNIVLHKYTALEDLIIATLPAAEQGNPEGVIFCRNHVAPYLTVKQVINRTKLEVLEAMDHAWYPLEDILKELHTRHNANPLSILNTAFIYEPFQKKGDLLTQFDLVFILSAADNRLRLEVEYPSCPGLPSRDVQDSREIAEKFSGNLIATIERMLENPHQEIAAMDILTPREKNQLVYEFNHTAAQYPQDKTIHELFQEQVTRTPHHTALVFEKTQVTYGQLNSRANQLAGMLRKKARHSSAIMGLLVKRSPGMVMGLLAILKAGRAYLPLDPLYPRERIRYMLEESNTQLVLTGEDITGKFENSTLEYQPLDIFDETLYINEDEANPGHMVSSSDPAYVIYTSGSTGHPKGVIIEHGNVTNFAQGMSQWLDFSPGKTMLALTTISFDIFVLEVVVPLLKGLKIIVASQLQQNDPRLLTPLMDKNRVDMLQVTPSRLKLLLVDKNNFDCLQGTQALMVGGEPFPADLLIGLKNKYPGKIYNLYGPTETTVWSAGKDLSAAQEVTIGKPISNTQVYIIDKHNQLQPVGAVGELCIGGAGVSRGYLNNPELTADKFRLRRPGGALFEKTAPPGPPRKNFLLLEVPGKINNHGRSPHYPITPLPQSPIYRTGDLARWLPDGDLECLGRID
ncbi:MAG: amino acid adenylation domain-containing protein, partial [Candidatus Aminicenantes bacterium]